MSFEKLFSVEHFPSIPRELYLSLRSFSSNVLAERSNLEHETHIKQPFPSYSFSASNCVDCFWQLHLFNNISKPAFDVIRRILYA